MTRPISLYVHVPFCTVKCAYCDFNSYAGMEDAMPAWESALLRELRLWAPVVAGRPVPTVFIGGGTPSLLEGASIARIMHTIRDAYALEPGAEITLEANPESVALERLRAYRAAGVNRLSMGVQSLDPDELQFLDRLHDADRARWAFDQARAAGFDNVNCDLIFGLPGQSLESWRRSLEGVAAFGSDQAGPDHLSCYGLTVEDGTPLAQRVAEGRVAEADPDVVADIAEWTEERLSELGYAQYEISNWARERSDGESRPCRHNLVYWRQGEYVGVGPGAHGFVDGVRYAVERSPMRYVTALQDQTVPLRQAQAGRPDLPSPAVVSHELVDPATAAIDAITLGLRLNAGIDETEMRERYGDGWSGVEAGLDWGVREGLLERNDRLRLTSRGRRLANEVFVRVLAPELV
ncbi:MAG: oxygen-independent coproporphyrinogen-3 oxidase [Chloroflexi bacterium]|nr:MAG: oxygen-independent coproporphyrinogen-3 oxidase [Chloroflexota bacterium]